MPATSGWTTSGQSKRRASLPKNWQALRKRVIARDRGVCVWCGAPGTDVDHIERSGSQEGRTYPLDLSP